MKIYHNSIGWYKARILEVSKEYIETVYKMALTTSTIKSSIVLDLISSFNKIELEEIDRIQCLKERLQSKDEEIQRLKSRNLIQRILNT